jgi:hypothetical protein
MMKNTKNGTKKRASGVESRIYNRKTAKAPKITLRSLLFRFLV